jgi:site-specific recombinase XerD
MCSVQPLLDAAGRRRSPATTPGFHTGIAPPSKGQRYPADPPTVDETVALMRQASHDGHGHRLNALIVVLRRAGLRINEALSLTETDLDQRRGSILVRHDKNDRRREVGDGRLGVVSDRNHGLLPGWRCRSGRCSDGPTRGRAWSASAARVELGHLALNAGVRCRFAPHKLRHAHAVELPHEGIPLPVIQRQLGHSHSSTTGTYLEGINNEEIISTVHARRAPMMHASASLAL